MPTSYTFARSDIELHRLIAFSLFAFGLVTFSFFVSLTRADYDPRLALLACTCAAMACLLLRQEEKVVQDEATVAGEVALPVAGQWIVASARMIISLDALLRDTKVRAGQVGLMLVSVQEMPGERESSKAQAISSLSGVLSREAPGSRVIQLDDHTLAVAQSEPEVDRQLGRLSWDLHSTMRTEGLSAKGLDPLLMRIGIAVAGNDAASAADLLSGARQALRLAAAEGRDTLFKHVLRLD